MKLPHTFYSLLTLLCVLLLNTGSVVADLSSDAETLFEWAEENYPEYFPPPGASTQFLDPWLYRYYPATDIYSGVNSNSEVWVLGDIFGGLLYIGTVEELLDIVTESQTPEGTWTIKEIIDGRSCGDIIYSFEYFGTVVVEEDNQLTLTANGIVRSGVLNGNTVSFSISYPEEGGITTATGTLEYSGNSVSGTSNWSWSIGNYSCSGTTTISGTKI